jgi:hypothetical protein
VDCGDEEHQGRRGGASRVRRLGGRGGRLRTQLTVLDYLLEIGGKGGGGGTERAPAGIQTQ